MKKEELYNAPKYAGIYYFKNDLNGKYYIGQAVKLRSRLLHHMNNFEHDRYNAPLYRAFKKYGLSNFSWGVLDTFRNALSAEVKCKLDELEKKYIKEYNSYGATGYNQTYGGDAGVLGLKHSNETLEKLKILKEAQVRNKERTQEDWVKAKNIDTGDVYIAIAQCYLRKMINCNSHAGLLRCLNKTQHTLTTSAGTFVIAKYNEDFPDAGNSLKYNPKRSAKNKEEGKIKKQVREILSEFPTIKPSEVVSKYGINRNTFLRYRKELGMVPEYRTDSIIDKDSFISYYIDHSIADTAAYFGITLRRCYKYRKRFGL